MLLFNLKGKPNPYIVKNRYKKMKNLFSVTLLAFFVILTAVSCTRQLEPINKAPKKVNQYDPFNLNWDDPQENYFYQPDGGLIILNDTVQTFEGCTEIMLIDCDRFRSFEVFCLPAGIEFNSLQLLQRIYDHWHIGHDNVAVWKWEHGGSDFDKNIHLGFIRK